MANLSIRISNKHIQIDKANSLMVVAVAVTTVVVVFSLVATQSLWKQFKYQNKVISLRQTANKQLTKNIEAVDSLKKSYDAFEGASESVIGTADKNSKITLDSLPSKYDFPALATSLEGIITGSSAAIVSITGTDNEAAAEQNSINPQPVEIPFDISARANFANAKKLIDDMGRSIRPFQIKSIKLAGGDNNLTITVNAITYYQPEKKLEIEQKVIPGTTNSKAKSSTTSKTSQSGAKK